MQLVKDYALDITGLFFNSQFIIMLIDYNSSFSEILKSQMMASAKIVEWQQELFICYGMPN
ncbi:MAG: hypothetical protein GY737_26610 [Desulfobacteraceae bacterium]|nr:hypothetical protein [Desulfobacteraceae bacterium]